MEKITQEISKTFNGEYDFLKLFQVTFDKQTQTCTIVFLYPENQVRLSNEQKIKIRNCLKNFFNIDAKLEVKFRKSYLEKQILYKLFYHFLSVNYLSLTTDFKQENFISSHDNGNVEILIKFGESAYQYFVQQKLSKQFEQFFQQNFCGKISFSVVKIADVNHEDILEQRLEVAKEIRTGEKISRYEVHPIKKLFGADITPFPEFIKNINQPKSSVLLAGKVGNLKIGKFKKKSGGKNAGQEREYYSFSINDGTGIIYAMHFCTLSSQKQMVHFSTDAHVLLKGDIRRSNNEKLVIYVNSITLCFEQKKQEQLLAKESLEKRGIVFPQPYNSISQVEIFEKQKIYNDFINQNTIVVFDTETTGIELEISELIEIGAVKIKNGKIIQTFQTLIKPESPISDFITSINNISNEMVQNSPCANDVIFDFMDFCADSVLVAYNADFDMKFIQRVAKNNGTIFNNTVVDCLILAREKLHLNSYKLGKVVKHLNISLVDAHRALADAIATANVLLKLSEV
ncbi:MAG: exonuclease domain-containing protein [Clostridia bacterium]